MKLVEIKDVRPNQIWKDDEDYLILIGTDLKGTWYNSNGVSYMGGMELCDTVHHKLTGFLGITHGIKDNKLVEITRNDEVTYDDVVTYFDFDHFENIGVVISLTDTNGDIRYGFITDKGVFDSDECFEHEEIGEDTGIFTYTPKKIGILGVTHEFVNDREV